MLGCGGGSTAARRGRNVGLRERTRVRHGSQTAQACKTELTRVQSDQDLEYVPLGIPIPNPTNVARSLSSYNQTNQDARVELGTSLTLQTRTETTPLGIPRRHS